jgi:hypothetical protein
MRLPLAGGSEHGFFVKSHDPLLQPNPVSEHTTGESRKQMMGQFGSGSNCEQVALSVPKNAGRTGLYENRFAVAFVEAARFLSGLPVCMSNTN